jgi:hypothetical protein
MILPDTRDLPFHSLTLLDLGLALIYHCMLALTKNISAIELFPCANYVTRFEARDLSVILSLLLWILQ